jgi:hypothetical protein
MSVWVIYDEDPNGERVISIHLTNAGAQRRKRWHQQRDECGCQYYEIHVWKVLP